MQLLQYPLNFGINIAPHGCLTPDFSDSGNVAQLLPTFAINNNNFSNVAVSVHMPLRQNDMAMHNIYNDCYYMGSGCGIIKASLRHTATGKLRVLQLQRYKIVK